MGGDTKRVKPTSLAQREPSHSSAAKALARLLPSDKRSLACWSICRLCLRANASDVGGSGRRGKTFWLDCTRQTYAADTDARLAHPSLVDSEIPRHSIRTHRKTSDGCARGGMRPEPHQGLRTTTNACANATSSDDARPRFYF